MFQYVAMGANGEDFPDDLEEEPSENTRLELGKSWCANHRRPVQHRVTMYRETIREAAYPQLFESRCRDSKVTITAGLSVF